MNYIQTYENFLFEIGDSSAKRFPWKSKQSFDSFFKYAIAEGKKNSTSGDLNAQWFRLKNLEITVSGGKAEYDVKIGTSVRGAFNLSFGGDSNPADDYDMLSAISFNVKGATEELETNLNEQYSLMATLTDIIIEFLNTSPSYLKIQKFYIKPKSDNNEDNPLLDSRRGKLYLAYIKNNIKKLSGSWTAEMDKEGITIMRGKWSTNDPNTNYIYNI
jgi:hypothetical protein